MFQFFSFKSIACGQIEVDPCRKVAAPGVLERPGVSLWEAVCSSSVWHLSTPLLQADRSEPC